MHAWGPLRRGDPERACEHGPGASVRACVPGPARACTHDPVRACVGTPRASGHGDPVRACVHGPRERVGMGTRTRCVRAWRRSGRGDPVRASVHGPRERAGVGTQCEQRARARCVHACIGPVRAACTGPVRACMHRPSACVRACVPCECVRAWIQRARTRACGDPARATSSSSRVPISIQSVKKYLEAGFTYFTSPREGDPWP
jgi:hypothetical protein